VSGIDLIAAERTRQVEEEEWTPEHDDEHTAHELALAAAAYAAPEQLFRKVEYYDEKISFLDCFPTQWDSRWDKRHRDGQRSLAHADDTPREIRIRHLAKAGALIAAEIDRLLRINSGS